jgi:hypothetical protein
MAVKKAKKMAPKIHDSMSGAHPRAESGAETAPLLVHENYVIEGNCRVACIRMIAEQVNTSRRRSGRATSHSRGDSAGPAPPLAPDA